MAFLSPWFLAGLSAAAVPIVLHLLKRRPDVKVKFSAVHLLRQAPIEHASRRRLRELLLLALRVAAVVLLALAFARPFFASSAAASDAGATMVLLDTSLSMSAPGQFEKARARAREIVNGTSGRQAVGLMTFDDRAALVERPSTSHGRVLAAIDAARPGAGGTNYRAALSAAGALVSSGPSRLVVITDLQASAWDAGDSATIPASAQIEVADIGAPPPDLAVTKFEVEGRRLIGTVVNTGTSAVNATLTLVSGQAAGERGMAGLTTTASVAPGGEATFSFPRPDASWASVSVDDPAGIEDDNVRYLVLAGESRPAILVITATGDLERDALYLTQALQASGSDGATYRAEGVAASEMQSREQPWIDAFQAVVLMSTRGLEHHGRELLSGYLRRGGGLLVAGATDVDADVLSETLGGLRVAIAKPDAGSEARRLIPADMRHPILEPFSGRASLGLVTFRQVTPLRAEACRALGRFTSGETALLDCDAAGGHAVVLGFDVSNRGNDFPLHATFLPFIHEAVAYLAGARRPSEVLIANAPAGQRRPGIVGIPGDVAAPVRLVAVNVDRAEIDAARLTPDEFQSAVVRLKAVPLSAKRSDNEEQEDQQRLWMYALTALVAVLAAESLVAIRAG